jgi:hypothetical protein
VRTVTGLVLALAIATAATARPPVVVGDALCVSQSDGPFLALSTEARDAYLAALADAGWRCLRIDFTWSRIQPAPPPAPLDFSRYDALVDQAAAHGIRLTGILDYSVDWAAAAAPPDDDRYPPDDPATFAAFAGEAAARYRGRVQAWEVWNEPNNSLSGFWKPVPDPGGYARLAKAAATAITRADRKATIVTGGLAPTFDLLVYQRDWGFFTAASQAERRWFRRFDAAALHPYSYLQAAPPEQENPPLGPSVPHQIRDFRDRLTESHATRLPLWVTELGWHTAPDSGFPGFPPGVSELDQARFLVRATILALAQGVERVCWYTLLDYPSFLTNKEDAFGLFHYDAMPTAATLDPKPAYQAAKTLGTLLGPLRFAKDSRIAFNLPPDGYAFQFRRTKPAQTIVVYWATRDDLTVHVRIAANVKHVQRVDLDGTITDLGKPEVVDIPLSASPVYLIFDGFTPL